ncbi:MAG: hypothetical protein JEZ06_01980 [Anaerolineaceae bacterium]|nr:hypothetical protein [Anaerolineaceae bacterium]
MRRLPRSIIILLIFMILVFNIERLTLHENSIINIHGFVYALFALLIITILGIRWLRQKSIGFLLIFGMVVYLIGKILIFNDRPFIGGTYTYFTLIEISVISLGILFSYRLGDNLEDFIEAVENITFDDLKRVSTVEEGEEVIQTEIYRSRRFAHPLNLVVVEPETESLQLILNRSIEDIQRSMMVRYVSIGLARALRNQLRRTDMLFEQYDKRRFIILTPETKIEGSPVVMRRVHKAAEKLGATVRCGAAAFPMDAYTFEELVKVAETRLTTFEGNEETTVSATG